MEKKVKDKMSEIILDDKYDSAWDRAQRILSIPEIKNWKKQKMLQ